MKEKIKELSEDFIIYELDFSDAAKSCPNQKDVFDDCAKVISHTVKKNALQEEILKSGELPTALLSAETGIKRDIIEKHRKYIMSMIILHSRDFKTKLEKDEYIVMECSPEYAVLFDGNRKFIRTENPGFSVGDTVTGFTEIEEPKKPLFLSLLEKESVKFLIFAVFFCIMFASSWYFLFTPAGTVRLSMNPDVLLSFNKAGLITEAVGLNEEGEIILEGFDRGFKNVKRATVNILRRARDFGYLKEGDPVSVQTESESEDWELKTEKTIKEIVFSRKLIYIEIEE